MFLHQLQHEQPYCESFEWKNILYSDRILQYCHYHPVAVHARIDIIGWQFNTGQGVTILIILSEPFIKIYYIRDSSKIGLKCMQNIVHYKFFLDHFNTTKEGKNLLLVIFFTIFGLPQYFKS